MLDRHVSTPHDTFLANEGSYYISHCACNTLKKTCEHGATTSFLSTHNVLYLICNGLLGLSLIFPSQTCLSCVVL